MPFPLQTHRNVRLWYLPYSFDKFLILVFVREKIFVQVYSNPDKFPVTPTSVIWLKYPSRPTGSNTIFHLLQNVCVGTEIRAANDNAFSLWYFFLPYARRCSQSKGGLHSFSFSAAQQWFSVHLNHVKIVPELVRSLSRAAITPWNLTSECILTIHLRSNVSSENLNDRHLRWFSSF